MLLTERFAAGRSMNSLVTGLGRQGAEISPATLAGTCAQAGALLVPLADAITERSRGSWHLHADETTGRVFAPRDRDGPAKWWLWARAIAVSLLWSFANPAHEKAVRRIIREEYKSFHVGYLPVVLSHEVVGKVGEYERTMRPSWMPTCRRASSSSWRPPGISCVRTAIPERSC